jgi:hypothetical protein
MAGFDPTPASDWEHTLLARAVADMPAAFPLRDGKAEAVLRAPFLRHLLLGLPAPAGWGEPWPGGPVSIQVAGARIEGPLDLVDRTGPSGMALPPLCLEGCDLPDPADLSGARLARLSIKGSRFTHLRAHGLRLDGNFDFSQARGFGPPLEGNAEAIAWIDAHGARIAGDVEGRGARLRAPEPRPKFPAGTQQYALCLSNCDIGGRVILVDQFRGNGGVSFGDGDIRGEVWLSGATVSAGEGDALGGQDTRFGSALALDDCFTATGVVSLLGARIAGNLECTNATFDNKTRNGKGVALEAASAEIGGNMFLGGKKFRASGEFRLSGAKIAGILDCNNATFANPHGDTLIADNAEIGRDFQALRTVSIGTLRLWGTKVGGDSDLSGAKLFGLGGTAIRGPNLQVGGDLDLQRAVILGDVRFEHLDVKGSLDWEGAKVHKEHKEGGQAYYLFRARLNFKNATIGAELRAKNLTTRVKLDIDLGGAHIATLTDDWPEGWGGEEAIRKGRVTLNLDGFVYDRMNIPAEPTRPRVGNGARLKRLRERLEKSLDRSRALVARLPPPMGDRLRRFGAALVRLATPLWRLATGWIPEVWKPMARRPYDVRERLKWLELQRGGYFPQPYRQLAKVLRAHGREQAAREVAIAEGWRRAPGDRPSRVVTPFFGWGFRFGLSPGRATMTLIGFIVIGWIGSHCAMSVDHPPAMVLTAPPVVSILVRDQIPPLGAVEHMATALATVETPCGDHVISLFYAIDMMLPVTLHQESRCDVSILPQYLWLRYVKLAYSILGKIVTTLALITFSGVLHGRTEE